MMKFPDPVDLHDIPMLPDPFVRSDGSSVDSREAWDVQRVHLVEMLQFYLYGDGPDRPEKLEVQVVSDVSVLAGLARKRLFTLSMERKGQRADLRVGLITPVGEGPFPVIIKNDAYRFDSTETTDPKRRKKYETDGRDGVEEAAFEDAVRRGYAVCKFVRTDWADDHPDTRGAGIYPLYPDCDWGAIAVWAWTFSVLIDWLDDLPEVDAAQAIATGHSRGGKAALAAGILDERLLVTAPNSSGGGGTGSYLFFKPGLRQQRISNQRRNFPHWWHPRFYEFADRETCLPFDAHTMKALIAPRFLFNAHALQDDWANPYGTQLTYEAAQPVFAYLGVPERQGIHWREGGHAQGPADWLALLDFCDVHVKGLQRSRSFSERPFEYTDEHRAILAAFQSGFEDRQ